MSIGSLKERADKLAVEAEDQRQARNDHAARSLSVVRQRIASPVGLAVCFGAGVLAGSARSNARSNDKDSAKDREKGNGVASKVLHGPLGSTAGKFLSAAIATAMMRSDSS